MILDERVTHSNGANIFEVEAATLVAHTFVIVLSAKNASGSNPLFVHGSIVDWDLIMLLVLDIRVVRLAQFHLFFGVL